MNADSVWLACAVHSRRVGKGGGGAVRLSEVVGVKSFSLLVQGGRLEVGHGTVFKNPGGDKQDWEEKAWDQK